MASSTGTSVIGFQSLIVFPATDAWTAVIFNGAVKPPEGTYVGWIRIHRFNGAAWVEVNSRPLYGEGIWVPNVTASGTNRVSAIWRLPGYVWTTYTGPFA